MFGHLPSAPRLLTLAMLTLGAAPSWASMGNIGTTYGLMPSDVASAQALSMFNPKVAATYYNPAYLTRDPRGELTAGILHGEHELRAKSDFRDGDLLQDAPSQHVLIGMKTNVGSLTTMGHPIYLGFVAGVEKYGKEMLAFDAGTSEQGQFLEYGRQPLFLNVGAATEVWDGISVGYSARVTLHADASLRAVTDLAGNTKYETLTVNAKPSLRSILSANLDWGKAFCEDTSCLVNGLETAITYRSSSSSKTSVDANTVIPGTIPTPGLSLSVATLDSYQPETLALGVHYATHGWRVAVTLEQQNWSSLGDDFENDTIRDQAGLKFDDILIPRIGAQYHLNEMISLTTGVSFEKSPLKSDESLNVNYFDNDRIVIGLGATLRLNNAPFMAYPVQLDVGYQHHMLKERDFQVTYDRPGMQVNESVTADGDVHVLSAALTLKF